MPGWNVPLNITALEDSELVTALCYAPQWHCYHMHAVALNKSRDAYQLMFPCTCQTSLEGGQ